MKHESTTLRSYRIRDDDTALAAIATRATHEVYTAERIAYEIDTPGIDNIRDVIVCESVKQPVGYAVLSIDEVRDVRQGRLTCRIDPGAPPDAQRVTLLWAARRMQEEVDATDRPVTIVEMVKEEDLDRREFLEDAGFQTIRYYRVMRLDDARTIVEKKLPAEYQYVHGPGREGAEEYVAMFNDTWIDHYGFIPLTVELYMHDLDDDPEYNPALDIVVKRADGKFVGLSFCRMDPSEPALGEVMVIGIRRGLRGLGLGRTLLTHSVRQLVEHGAAHVELSVDSENPTGAERLYESVGFSVKSMKRRYQLNQPGIIRLATLQSC